MSTNNVLVAHFPRAAMGYAQSAVDEFVKQIGERLEEMHLRLDEVNEQNAQLKKQASATQKDQEQNGLREVALANAMLAIEQRRLATETEIDGFREQARRDGEAVQESARRDAEGVKAAAVAEAGQIVGKAKYSAEQMMDEAAAVVVAEEERLQSIMMQYDRTVDDFRKTLEMHLSLLPGACMSDHSSAAFGVSPTEEFVPTVEAATPPAKSGSSRSKAAAVEAFGDGSYNDEFITDPPFAAEAEAISAAA